MPIFEGRYFLSVVAFSDYIFSCQNKASVVYKLHDYSHHVLAERKSEQCAGYGTDVRPYR